MSKVDGIGIYVFSGPHVGAEIILPEGSYTLGTSDSCDIILTDISLAPRHAQLDVHIGENENTTYLTVIPLEGSVWANNQAVPESGFQPKPGEFWYLGNTSFGWNFPGKNWQNKAAQQYAETLNKAESDNNNLGLEDITTQTQEQKDDLVKKVFGDALPQDIISKVDKFSMGKLIGVCLLVLFLGAIAISYQRDSVDEKTQVKFLQKVLEDNGFSGVSVIPGVQQIIIRGVVQSDVQRQLIYTLAQGVHSPVYIDVGVRDDLVNAVKAAFASRGIHISVKEFSDPGIISISGYMKDGFVEEWSISAMRDDIPIPFKLEKHIVYAKEVAKVLDKIFAENKIGSLKVTYLAGEIEIVGSFDEERTKKLDKALEEIKKELDVPIMFKIQQIKPAPITSAQKGQQLVKDENDEESSVLGGSVIKGVTLLPIPFITLSTGERIFKGGVLPSGYTLDSVSLDKLVFSKDNQYKEYPLRGAN